MDCSSNIHPDPLNPEKQELCLGLDHYLVNKSINAKYNGKKVISFYPLLNTTELLARLWKCKFFSSLDLRLGYHHIGLTPETKPKTAFASTDGKCHWNVAPFNICSLPGVFY